MKPSTDLTAEPMSVEAAEVEIMNVLADIESCQADLGVNWRIKSTGERMSQEEFEDWRRTAKRALARYNKRHRYLRWWLAQQSTTAQRLAHAIEAIEVFSLRWEAAVNMPAETTFTEVMTELAEAATALCELARHG